MPSPKKTNSFRLGSIPASRDQFVGILRAKGYTLAEIGRRIGKSSERGQTDRRQKLQKVEGGQGLDGLQS